MNAKIVMEQEEKIEARINKFVEPQLTQVMRIDNNDHLRKKKCFDLLSNSPN